MADNICIIPFDGVDYPLNPRDITVSRLREYKQRYGADYGRYVSFVNLFLNGDADAIACAISIVLRKAGIKRPPDAIEFSPYDIFEAIEKANEKKAELEEEGSGDVDPTGPSVDEPTPDGTGTSTI